MLENNWLISKKGIFLDNFLKACYSRVLSLPLSLIFKRNSSLNLGDFPDDFSWGKKKKKAFFLKNMIFQ